jgi:hypothetical protein
LIKIIKDISVKNEQMYYYINMKIVEAIKYQKRKRKGKTGSGLAKKL